MRFTPLLLLAACGSFDYSLEISTIEDTRRSDSTILMEAIEAGTPSERVDAARAMGRIQSAAYADALAKSALSDESKSVRIAALFALGQLGLNVEVTGLESARRACSLLISDKDEDIVLAAVEATGKLGGPTAAESVTPVLQHVSGAARAEAALALFRIAKSKSVAELPAKSVEALIASLSDPAPEVRRAATYAFSRVTYPQAFPALTQRIYDEDLWVRFHALQAFSHSKNAEGTERILYALSDPNEHIRAAAIRSLGKMGAVDDIPTATAQDRSWHVRRLYARALAGSNEEATLEVLGGLANDESATVAGEAIEALAARRGADFRDDLIRYLANPRRQVRKAAARAVRHLGKAGYALFHLGYDDIDALVQTSALEATSKIAGTEEILTRALDSEDRAIRTSAVSVLTKSDREDKLEVLSFLYEGSPGLDYIEVREKIAAAAGELEGGKALLKRMLGDPAPSVRSKARVALAKLGVRLPAKAQTEVTASRFLGKAPGKNPTVVLETSQGNMEILCYAADAPIHTASFLDLVESGFYDGLSWHRIVSGFVIQGGDPRGDGSGGPDYMLRDEINRVRYERGTVGMAKTGKDTGGSQLFITQVPTPHLDGNYTVFGMVIEGLGVLDRIDVGDRIRKAWVREK